MRASIFIPIVLLIVINHLSAQTIQRGVVYEMNSGNKPISGTSIVVIGAIPTDSDNNGKFQLVFSKIQAGKQVIVKQIYKEGYETVNETDIKNWTLSEKNEFKVVLCKKGRLDESRRKFYDIGQDRYYTLWQQSRKELEQAKNANQMSVKQFENELEKIAAEYERAMSQLAFYADKFARINKDDLNELDAAALALVEEGKIDEAIKLYDESKILQKFNDRVSQRDTATFNADVYSSSLESEIVLLKEKGDSTSIERINDIYRLLLRHNDKSYRYNFEYASFLVQLKHYEEAFPYYKQSLLVSHDGQEESNSLIELDKLYVYIGNTDTVYDYRKQIDEVMVILKERKEIDKLK